MKKLIGALAMIILFSLLFGIALADVEVNEENFPDAAFRDYIKMTILPDGGMLTDEIISQTTHIIVSDLGIADLKGIEHFTALTFLYCGGNQLTVLDVSSFPLLEFLDCSRNQLTHLDISKNPELKELHCYLNQIADLDISNCLALTDLHCMMNQLTKLDVTKNAALTVLCCDENQLTELDTLMGKTDEIGNFTDENQGTLYQDVKSYLEATIKKHGKNLSKADKDLILQTLLSGEADYDFREYDRACSIKSTWMPWSLNFKSYDYDENTEATKKLLEIIDVYTAVRDEMIQEFLSIPYTNSSMVSDVYNGMTNNKLGCGYNLGIAGHIKYWEADTAARYGWMNGNQMEEAWAEYYAAKITGDTEAINRNKQYFGKTCAKLDKLSESLLDAYIKLYKDY